MGNVKATGGDKYRYDTQSRLTGATMSGVAANPYQGYTYDRLGNLTQVARGSLNESGDPVIVASPGPQEYPANGSNQLASSTTAVYDGRGNLKSFQGSTFLWDRLDQLKSVTNGNEKWVHVYDADGERVWSWRPWAAAAGSSRIDNYTLRGLDGKVLREYTKTGSSWAWEDTVYREGQLLASAKSDGAVRHYALDHLGSVRYVTNGSGQKVSEHKYWPFGQEITSQADGGQMRFTGHERDLGVTSPSCAATCAASGTCESCYAEAGNDDLDYMHARYYKPIWGRFLSVDPVGGSPGNPQSWNRYAYVLGNPMSRIDPDGRKVTVPDWLRKTVDRGNERSARFAAIFSRMNDDPRVNVTFSLVERAKPGTVLDSQQTVTKAKATGEVLKLEQVVLVPVGAAKPENVAHELFHGEEILDTGKTLRERAAAGDKTVTENSAGWESTGAKEVTQTVRQEVSNWGGKKDKAPERKDEQ